MGVRGGRQDEVWLPILSTDRMKLKEERMHGWS